MKWEALIRDLCRYARTRELAFDLDVGLGKGSHHGVRLHAGVSTIQSGEPSPLHIARICKQLGIDARDL